MAMRRAVVVAQAVPAREGPAEKSVSRFEIHEGTTVRVDDEEAGFRRIKLANGLTGWVPAASLELVVPPGWAGRPLLTGSARAVQPRGNRSPRILAALSLGPPAWTALA